MQGSNSPTACLHSYHNRERLLISLEVLHPQHPSVGLINIGMDTPMSGLDVQPIPHGDPHMMLPMVRDEVQTAPELPVQGRAGVTNSDDDLAAMLLVAIAAEQHYA